MIDRHRPKEQYPEPAIHENSGGDSCANVKSCRLSRRAREFPDLSASYMDCVWDTFDIFMVLHPAVPSMDRRRTIEYRHTPNDAYTTRIGSIHL